MQKPTASLATKGGGVLTTQIDLQAKSPNRLMGDFAVDKTHHRLNLCRAGTHLRLNQANRHVNSDSSGSLR